MIRASVIVICLLAAGAIVSVWAFAPIVRGPTAFDVAYARLLDGQAAAGELRETEERFHKIATRHFQQGDWRARLAEPAWQLRLTAPGHAINIAYAAYSPDAVRDRADESSFEWQHFHYQSRKSQHGSYLVFRGPVWPPTVALLLYPTIQFARWRRVRWFWRGIAWLAGSTQRAVRQTGIRWCVMIAPPLLLSMVFVPLWIISYVQPIEWKWPDPELYPPEYADSTRQFVTLRNALIVPTRAAGTGSTTTAIVSLREGAVRFQYTDFDPSGGALCAMCGSTLASGGPPVRFSRDNVFVCMPCEAKTPQVEGWSGVFSFRRPVLKNSIVSFAGEASVSKLAIASLILTATLVGLRPYGPYRRWIRRRRQQCLNCAYNLTGNTSGVCPECGREVGARNARQ